MITLRPGSERGHANYGWLDTYHTFSFNTYYDEKYMGFRSLRVINEDRVQPGRGFATHPHRDMEILTYVLAGALEHKDSMDHGSVIRPGDVQRMSAGTGVLHSEFNHSQTEVVHFQQIWILPNERDLRPSYEQRTFRDDQKEGAVCLLASPDGRDDSVTIHQDAYVYATVLRDAQTLTMPVAESRAIWVHVTRGSVMLNDQLLHAGDGAGLMEETSLTLTGRAFGEILLFDLA